MDGKNSERTAIAQAYLDLSALILLDLGNDGQVRFINPRGAEIVGFPEEEIVGKNWIENFVPVSARHVVQEVFRSIASGSEKGPNRSKIPSSAVTVH